MKIFYVKTNLNLLLFLFTICSCSEGLFYEPNICNDALYHSDPKCQDYQSAFNEDENQTFDIDKTLPTPKFLKIEKIGLRRFPALKGDATPWDVGSSPDALFAFGKASSPEGLKYTDNYYENISRNGYYVFSILKTLPISAIKGEWSIALYDFDADASEKYQFMCGFYFNPIDKMNGYPDMITLRSYYCEFDVYLEWMF